MCGLAGFLDRGPGREPAAMAAIAGRMADTLRHRGPDDSGVWVDPAAGVALAHRRLSILDLSALGRQPMASESGDWVLIYNGEIYNFAELRAELESRGHRFRGHSDTEVMLAAFEEWGLPAALDRFNGMFAFAAWHRPDRTLYLARDRLGKKPLYYGWAGNVFLFASELKALRAHPAFEGEIDPGAVALLLRHNYIPHPYSIYRGIRSLAPATVLAMSNSVRAGELPRAVPYWSHKLVAEQGLERPVREAAEALEQLEALLRDAVKLRMIADVPLGALLSGGIDSSLVVALMQAQSTRPVMTFSIGFREEGFDEAPHARAVAAHLGTDHTELYVTPAEARDVIPLLPEIYDEPFADASQIPTFLVSKLARSRVTVALSGDGGDELFGGYAAYLSNLRFWRRYGKVPLSLRRLMAGAARSLSPETWDGIFARLASFVPAAGRRPSAGLRLHRLAAALTEESEETVYCSLMSHWQPPLSPLAGVEEPLTAFRDPERRAVLPGFAERMMYLDLISYLPDDILVKVDRASMAVSLEARCPLLDYRVAELAWRLPLELKIRDGKGKWILRQLLHRYVPQELVERPKAGFAPPVGAWIRGPLRDWAEELIRPARLLSEGLLDPAPIHAVWKQHVRGHYDWGMLLWPVLVFQAWRQAQTRPPAA